MLYHIFSSILFVLIKLFNRLEIRGKANIPSGQRYVVTCSHKGWVDVIMLAIALYPTPVHYMAKKELFEGKWKNRFFQSIKAFPVNRENPGPSTLKIPLKLLKENKCVGIFPSGTRTNEDLPLKRGAVTIAAKANAPLLPAVFKGPTNFSQLFKGEKSIVVFGEPIIFQKEQKDGRKEDIIEKHVELLVNEMKNLEKTL
ncbi:1-acyl-sn-glycerol-3-phosphate acyltransferase [Bacillus sp. S/N-304-OC-R1]|uniref:lysophospholipid acyltransferase family protein n=1 Tax=Bacillus sp. S/N-304-OC-R1 TaxID=2758034 RepID=UPI001C8D1947|nr:lysophospholipid acyltransferase family protein [Bacillus sp. S/N-304-OC-R1]MBY0123051.1 1-acyl-sn-glycerol-3-phosphate acyltransferase [Bacillus sp. S/N-304-OC-R1]